MVRISLSLPQTLALVTAVIAAPSPGLAPLPPESSDAWSAYVASAERRISREVGSGDRFLALDFAPGTAAARQAVAAGRVVVEPMSATDGRGSGIEIPGAMVHHWRGAVLIPGATVDGLLRTLYDAGVPGRQEDVLASRVLARGPDSMRVYLKLQRSRFVTVVYNTEHDVRFTRHGANRASSHSTAVKIAELRDANTAAERELAPGQDRGFLWRWQAYWRYEQVPGGVIAECESISLSRDIPFMVRYVVRPLVESTARESMERTLATLRKSL